MSTRPRAAQRRRGIRRAGALLAGALVAAVLAGPARADTITSHNWSGYAVHGNGLRFTRVSGQWREPSAVCVPGHTTYSAFWVGLGGYSLTAPGMEQIGTEVDCSAAGRQEQSAWSELVPAASRDIRMTVAAGDEMSATVTVIGHRVTVALDDLTRHETYLHSTIDHTIDRTSAEWIAEAPSDCTTASNCTTLPLADFRSVRFTDAWAWTSSGAQAGIDSGLWQTTKLLLGYSSSGTTFVRDSSTANATPSVLRRGGHAFTVRFSGSNGDSTGGGFPGGPPPFGGRRA